MRAPPPYRWGILVSPSTAMAGDFAQFWKLILLSAPSSNHVNCRVTFQGARLRREFHLLRSWFTKPWDGSSTIEIQSQGRSSRMTIPVLGCGARPEGNGDSLRKGLATVQQIDRI
jgi:hypothetical protein